MLSDALGEVARGLENIEFACEIPHLPKGGSSEQVSGGVDLQMAADAAVSSAFGSAGERCMAISVVVAVDGVGDALVDAFIDAISSRMPDIAVGPGNVPGNEMGPVIRRNHCDRVAGYVGMVGLNVPIPVPVSYYSFGGWKSSLFGDRHIYGPEGIGFYTHSKVVTTRRSDPATSGVDLGFPQNN